MRDHHERARPAVEHVLQRGQRVGVEVVGRLVEQQYVRLVHKQSHQSEPSSLPAGEVGDGRPGALPGEAQTLHELGGADLLATDLHRTLLALHGLDHSQVADLVELAEVLCQDAHPHGAAAPYAPRVRDDLAG